MAKSINQVILCGRLGSDPNVRVLDSGIKVANFSLATGGEKYTRQDGREIEVPTQWHSIICWKNLADLSEKYLKKGQAVTIFGEINYRKYTDSNGVDRITTDIVASDIFFSGSSDGGQKAQTESRPTTQAAPQPAPQAAPGLFPEKKPDDGLPF